MPVPNRYHSDPRDLALGETIFLLSIVDADGGVRDGILETGDLGFLAAGPAGREIVVVGRAKEAIRVGGRVVHALDLERLVDSSHPAFSIARVVAVQDDAPDGDVLLLAEIDAHAHAAAAADAARAAIAGAFPDLAIHIVLVPTDAMPVVPTSSKKPRLRAAAALREGRLAVVHETSGTASVPSAPTPSARRSPRAGRTSSRSWSAASRTPIRMLPISLRSAFRSSPAWPARWAAGT
ncbi:MAG: hypothetical protein ACFE0R_04105 [Salinarimonas sp.]